MGERVKAAQAEAGRRLHREGRQFTPVRFGVVAVVLLVAATSSPSLGLSGRRGVLSACLVVFVVEMIWWPILRRGAVTARVGELTVMALSAIGLAGLQPHGVSELAGSAVVFIAGVALPERLAIVLGGAVTAGVAAALGSDRRAGAASVAAAALLCAVLGVTGALLRRYRLSQNRTELLLAELEEARDDQARAAAAEERASIARELHDVLAHSLSGLAIQLEAGRKIAASADAPAEVRAAIESAASLAKDGLVEARRAVGALRRRDDELGLEHVPELVEHFRRDLRLSVTYEVAGTPRRIAPEIGLAFYRVAGEALTNVARHAHGAMTRVEVTFGAGEVQLAVTDEGGEAGPLAGQGSGWGLVGLQERIRRLGGELVAGPSGSGWAVVARAPT